MDPDRRYSVFDYVDTPDLTMNELVSEVRLKLLGKAGVGWRLAYVFGIIIGCLADMFSLLIQKRLSVSYIRVKNSLHQQNSKAPN